MAAAVTVAAVVAMAVEAVVAMAAVVVIINQGKQVNKANGLAVARPFFCLFIEE
jgi:hypothetical protein